MNWPMENDVILAFHVQFKPNIGKGFTLSISFIFKCNKFGCVSVNDLHMYRGFTCHIHGD
jgi:hypothetical protein